MRGPRRQARSSSRTRRRHSAGSRPAWAKGCLRAASSAIGLGPSTRRRRVRSRKLPGAVWSSGVPALSSIVIRQRRSSAATRRASWRSSVTKAALRPGCSSQARRRSAMARASLPRSGWTERLRPARPAASSGRSATGAKLAAGRSARLSSRARDASAAAAVPGQSATSDRASPSAVSKPCKAACGWLGGKACQLASSSPRSRPGRTTSPRGSAAIVARRCRVAGMLPVEPAATIRPAGGAACQRAASAARTWLRRAAGSSAACAARISGQRSPRIARICRLCCQCSARSSGTRRSRAASGTSSVCSSSSKAARSPASWNARSGGQPSGARSRASRRRRLRLSIAGGRSASMLPSSSSSSASRSPIG